jgi:hypothetical protein
MILVRAKIEGSAVQASIILLPEMILGCMEIWN